MPHATPNYLAMSRGEAHNLYKVLWNRWVEIEREWQKQWDGVYGAIPEIVRVGGHRGKAALIFLTALTRLKSRPKRAVYPKQYVGLAGLTDAWPSMTPWSYWRGKRWLIEHGYLYVKEHGGGRLKGSRFGRWKGRADGVVPGPAITGWGTPQAPDHDRYRAMIIEAPEPPDVSPVDPMDHVTHELGKHVTGNLQLLRLLKKLTDPLYPKAPT